MILTSDVGLTILMIIYIYTYLFIYFFPFSMVRPTGWQPKPSSRSSWFMVSIDHKRLVRTSSPAGLVNRAIRRDSISWVSYGNLLNSFFFVSFKISWNLYHLVRWWKTLLKTQHCLSLPPLENPLLCSATLYSSNEMKPSQFCQMNKGTKYKIMSHLCFIEFSHPLNK